MARAVVVLITVGVAIYAVVDCLRSRPEEVRYLPRFGWILLVVLFPLAGAITYLLFGRVGAGIPAPAPPNRPRTLAPDDDPEFLRSLRIERPRRHDEAEDDGLTDA